MITKYLTFKIKWKIIFIFIHNAIASMFYYLINDWFFNSLFINIYSILIIIFKAKDMFTKYIDSANK